MSVQEKCPKCEKAHTQGKYENQPNSNRVSPKDIQCKCGLALRWSVPFFKSSESGYVLRPLKDTETAFF